MKLKHLEREQMDTEIGNQNYTSHSEVQFKEKENVIDIKVEIKDEELPGIDLKSFKPNNPNVINGVNETRNLSSVPDVNLTVQFLIEISGLKEEYRQRPLLNKDSYV